MNNHHPSPGGALAEGEADRQTDKSQYNGKYAIKTFLLGCLGGSVG